MDNTKRYLTPILWLYGVVSVTCLALVAFVAVLLLVLPLKLELRRTLIRGCARFWFFITGVRLNVHGEEHIGDRPAVVVANHASYLDGIILKAVLPTRFGFVIKREVTKVPLLHFLLRRIGSQFVERRNRYRGGQDARRIIEQARSGLSAAIFPEGTFQTPPGLQTFRPGAFAAAVAGKMDVIPVVIQGSRGMLSADDWLPKPGRITVTALPRLEINGEGRDAMKDIAQRSRAAIMSVLDEPDLGDSEASDEGSKQEQDHRYSSDNA